jgi:hypothetical protein
MFITGDADEFALSYMESQPDAFPRENRPGLQDGGQGSQDRVRDRRG